MLSQQVLSVDKIEYTYIQIYIIDIEKRCIQRQGVMRRYSCVVLVALALLAVYVGALKLVPKSPSPPPQLIKALKQSFAAFSIISSLGLSPALPPAHALDSTVSSAKVSMEKAVSTLEQSESRADVLSSMADLFEVTATKSVLTKSKYKAVRNTITCEMHTIIN